MIWRKIKTHWLLSALFLLFACSFCGSLSSHSVFASDSFLFDGGTFKWASNATNGPWNNFSQTYQFTGPHQWSNILDINNNIVVNNPNYTLYQYRYQGIGGGSVNTTSISASGEYASFSGQFNIVCMSIDSMAVVPWCDPYNSRYIEISAVVDSNLTQQFPIESQNVSTAITFWDWDDVPVYHADLKNATVTVYFDFVVRVPRSYSGGFRIGWESPNVSAISVLNPPDHWYAAYYESGSGTVSFSDDRELAMMQQQNNILNRQLALQEQQAQQDANDRDNVQNVSDDSESDGSNASSSANNATSSILGVITGIYSQLLYPHITSCRVFGVQIYELDLGILDFCTGFDMPPALMAIGSIGMIGLVLLLAWSVLHAAMSLYNDLFGGRK